MWWVPSERANHSLCQASGMIGKTSWMGVLASPECAASVLLVRLMCSLYAQTKIIIVIIRGSSQPCTQSMFINGAKAAAYEDIATSIRLPESLSISIRNTHTFRSFIWVITKSICPHLSVPWQTLLAMMALTQECGWFVCEQLNGRCMLQQMKRASCVCRERD